MYVDDSVPLDSSRRLLFLRSAIEGELWPVILSKAICKLLSASYEVRGDLTELGDADILHLLTGWLPEKISFTTAW